MIWLGFVLLALLALAFLLWPLLRTHRQGAGRKAHDITVYKAQLNEIGEELARGALSESEAHAARLEIQRRLLRADAASEGARTAASDRSVISGFIAVLLLVPVLGGGLYLALGRPDAAQLDLAQTQASAAQDAKLRAETERLIVQLRERLAADPNRTDGWLLLGRSLLATDRPAEAVAALDRAIALQPDGVEGYALRAEAQTMVADGSVTQAAQRDFLAVLEREPQHPGARYYLGLARLQEGDTRGAYDDWYALAADSPADAPWLDLVHSRLRELAPRLGIGLAQAVPAPKPAVEAATRDASGPSREQVDAAQQMSAEDRNAMVRGMVDRLAERLKENPNDAEGWLRLARAREVLGETDAVREALRRAVAVAPERVDARLALAFNLAGPTVTSRDSLPAEAVAEFGKVLEQAPSHPQALWFVGRGAYEAGDKAAAAVAWNRLLAQLPPGSPEAKELSERLASLSR
ncbi:MAG: c-type cytochrome biogenesis protein CcmI [Ferrovibrio sp.]|uniref:c-type cytochrome biogenesis protein CcmI n=1 Tax=Ferrovibrio sp. TaxID=1917215 RepID=UPI0026241410|nr:c-type cytochrome biogenesis protein CcmI [Ferrovibrio sp.]MCW0235901.1 c-type cytochrome biogenesis protein CcmI [Ferrovibrio sp.]